MSNALLPLLAIAAGLLVVAGVAKLRSPASMQEALGNLALPPRAWLARTIGAIEVGLGAATLLLPGWAATAALAGAYLLFSAVIGATRLRGQSDAPCGCFGEPATGSNLGHLGLNLACAAVAGAALVSPPPHLTTLAAGEAAPALALVAGTACSVYLIHALLTLLPDSWRAFDAAGENETS